MTNRKFSLALVLLVALAGCGGSSTTNTGTTSGEGSSITAAGSTALLPLVKQAAVDYQSSHSNVKINVSGGGSRVGLTQVAQKAVDIGDSDIPATGQPALVDHRVAIVTFGVVVNPKTGVKNLTTAQIRNIFSGSVKNWSEVGGASVPITIINRPPSSGTRAVFVQAILGGKQPTESGLTQDSSGTVATMVAQTPGAISYLGMAYVKPGQQQAVSVDGVAPNDANVTGGKYKYWSYEHMYTNGRPSSQVASFIAYVSNDKALLKTLHFLPVTK